MAMSVHLAGGHAVSVHLDALATPLSAVVDTFVEAVSQVGDNDKYPGVWILKLEKAVNGQLVG